MASPGLIANGAAAPLAHHSLCTAARGRDIDSGNTGYAGDFIATHFTNRGYDINFDINCAGCCAAYLIENRQYAWANTVGYGRVEFIAAGAAPPLEYTYAFVRNSQSANGVHGQLSTLEVPSDDGAETMTAAAGGGITFRIYGPADQLSMGVLAGVRLESVELSKVKVEQLRYVRLSLGCGALQELYKEAHPTATGQIRPSLRGNVFIKIAPSLMPAASSSSSSCKPEDDKGSKKKDDDDEDLEKVMANMRIRIDQTLSTPKPKKTRKSTASAAGTPAGALGTPSTPASSSKR